MEEKQWINYEITNHAKERYAERIMGRDTTADIRVFVKEHNQDIIDWINKLVNYGELLYTGSVAEHPVCKVYLKDYWCILVDSKIDKVITLYKINLGDDEINELFLKKMLTKIQAAKDNVSEVQAKSDAEIQEYQSSISRNNVDIQQYENKIKALKTANEGYGLLVKSAKSAVNDANYAVRTAVEQLIAKRNF